MNALRAVLVAFVLVSSGVLAARAQAVDQPVYTLHVNGLACPFCAYGIEKQLSKVEGVVAIDIDIKAGAITLTLAAGSTLEESTAREAIEAAGFELREFERTR